MSVYIPSATAEIPSLEVSENVFGREFNETLVHQLVVAYLASGRSGTKAQKNRSDVSGGGAKPWRQKGTGRARAGTTRSPIWRSGGVTFAARNRSYEQKINKKMYRAAMRSIFSELLRQGRLVVIPELSLPEAKTKLLISKLGSMGLQGGLLIAENVDPNIYLAARNNPSILVCDAMRVSPVSLVNSEKVMLTSGAAKKIEDILS